MTEPTKTEPGAPGPDEAAAQDRPAKPSTRRAVATGGLVALATLLSRITGFAKAVLVLVILTPAVSSAFNIANQIPNMVTELVLGAVVTQAFVPVLVRAAATDEDGGAAFTQRMIGLTLAVLVVATAASFVLVPALLPRFLDHGGGKVPGRLVAQLLLLLLPQIFFYGLFSLGSAVLNQRDRFQPGAWAPVVNNLVVIAALGVFLFLPESGEPNALTVAQILVLGLGATAGVVVQAAMLLPSLRRAGVRLRPKWGVDARLKQFGGTVAAMVCYVVISQIGLLVAYQVAGRVDEGGPSIYQNAWLLIQLPYGVFGVTIITMMTPQLSRAAAAGDDQQVVADLARANRFTMAALVPVVALMAAAGPLIGVSLFGYGKFDQAHAHTLGSVLSWSAFAILPYAVVLVQLRVFYARQQVWTPTWIVVGITAVKVAGSYLAPAVSSDPARVQELLGVANGLGYLFGAAIGFVLLRRSLGPLGLAPFYRSLVVAVLVSACGAALFALAAFSGPAARFAAAHGSLGSFALLAVLGTAGLVVIYAALFALRAPEIRTLVEAVRRRAG
ncbi:MAG: murein biosynthesis integral membrane protein MurJ [Segniliparus sp.]|uniref:murein biosynthesis integral membrane protein MurJ n=1 Tax=Segniliparus sp. TaxID=2804064 RepID=UPI003F3D2077